MPKLRPAEAVPPKAKGQGKRIRPAITYARVEKALIAACGVRAVAADLLGVHRSQITRFVQTHPALEQVIEDATEEMLDLAESKLHRSIEIGDGHAVRYFLDQKGASRGYGRKLELYGKGGGPIRTRQEPAIDPSKLSVAELEQMEALLAKAAPEPR